MAQRFHFPIAALTSGTPRLANAWREFGVHRGEILRRRMYDPRLFLWQALWLPYWLGSDRPAPSLPPDKSKIGPSNVFALDEAASYFRVSMVGLVRRFWISWTVAALLRGVWLSLFVTLSWMLLAIVGVVSTPSILVVGTYSVLLIGLGLIGGIQNRPTLPMVAAMLDRTFLLQERLTTASDAIDLGGTRTTERRSVPRLQMADAANVFDEVRNHLSWSRFIPVREIIGVLIAGMALLTTIFAYVPDRALPGIAESPIPAFVPASQRLSDPQIADPQAVSPPSMEESPPTVAEVQEQSRSSQSSREDLGAIGKALDDNPRTQPAAEAIANGDYATAADAIRSAANDAPSMSREERNALAGELDEAAKRISADNPELAQASRDAADGLRQGGEESTQELGGLADEVEETGERVVSPDQLSQDLEEARNAANEEQGSGSRGEGEADGGDQEGQNTAGQTGGTGAGALPDPGDGVAAEPGVGNQDQQGSGSGSSSGQQGGDTPGSESQDGAGRAPDGASGQPAQEPSSAGAASSGSASGEGGSESSGESSAPGGESQGLTGGPDEETNASQGSGAGTGQTGANDSPDGEQTVDAPAPAEGADPNADVPQNGPASDDPPTGNGQPGDPGNSGSVSGGSTSLVLEGTSDNGVRTGSDSGSSSLGSGSGAGTASGDQVQGEVGVAGPDSNRVPENKREIVEDYFSGPEGAP